MEAKVLSSQIENAQKKVEEQNFVMRKNVLKYDDVMNKQRSVIYAQRRQVLEGQDLSEQVKGWIGEVVERAVDSFVDPETGELDLDSLVGAMQALYGTDVTPDELREDAITIQQLWCHPAGVPVYYMLPEFAARRGEDISIADLTALLARKPLDFAPGPASAALPTYRASCSRRWGWRAAAISRWVAHATSRRGAIRASRPSSSSPRTWAGASFPRD
jgi:hypothetical protein